MITSEIKLDRYEPEYEYKNDLRFYKFSGKIYPGVTSILSSTISEEDKTKFKKWADNRTDAQNKELNIVKKESAKLGIRFHSAIAKYFEGHPIIPQSDETKMLWGSIESTLPLFSNPLLIEGTIWSDFYKFGGSCDFVGYYKNELCICDWKSSLNYKPIHFFINPNKEIGTHNYLLQLAAYRLAVKHTYGLNIDKGVIVMAFRKGKKGSTRGYKALTIELDKEQLNKFENEFIERVNKFYEINSIN
jgi:hypothetical protein